MGLLDLPDELLDAIVSLTLPSVFESFALSCKSIHRISKDRIAAYNEYRGRFRHLRFNDIDPHSKLLAPVDPENLSGFSHPIQLLAKILQDPMIAKYVETADLAYDDPYDFYNIDSHYDYSEEKAQLSGLLQNPTYLRHAGDYGGAFLKWLQMEWHQGGHGRWSSQKDLLFSCILPCALLLAFLPNLRELKLPREWMRLRLFPEEALDSQSQEPELSVRRALDSFLDGLVQSSWAEDKHVKPLAKLERLLPFSPVRESQEHPCLMEDIRTFLALPSLQEVYIQYCVATPDDPDVVYEFEWSPAAPSSQLRRLEMFGCNLTPKGMETLLKHTPLLEVLKYSHMCEWDGMGSEWSPGRFIGAIGRTVGKKLQSLAVTLHEWLYELKKPLMSLEDFHVLEEVELDVWMFCESRRDRDDDFSSDSDSGVTTTTSKWELGAVPCLTDILPSTIQQIRLSCFEFDSDITIPALGRLFLGFVERQSKTLPNLESASIRVAAGSIQWQQVAAAVGQATGEDERNAIEGLFRSALDRPLATDEDRQRAWWSDEFYQRFGHP